MLGLALEEDSNLHQHICNGLTLVIDNNKYVADGRTEQSDDAVKEAKANVAVLASFARNFLRCLFNVFGATSVENRPSVIKAIEAYVSITEASVRAQPRCRYGWILHLNAVATRSQKRTHSVT